MFKHAFCKFVFTKNSPSTEQFHFYSDVIEIFYILSTPGGTETFREIKISIFTDSEIKVPNCHWSDIIKGSSFLPLVCIVSLHVV